MEGSDHSFNPMKNGKLWVLSDGNDDDEVLRPVNSPSFARRFLVVTAFSQSSNLYIVYPGFKDVI